MNFGNSDILEKIMEVLSEDPATGALLINGVIEKYKPLLYAVGNELLSICKDLVYKDEIYELNAVGAKKRFDAYVAAGFSEDKAFALVLTDKKNMAEAFQSVSKSVNVEK